MTCTHGYTSNYANLSKLTVDCKGTSYKASSGHTSFVYLDLQPYVPTTLCEGTVFTLSEHFVCFPCLTTNNA